MFNSTYQYSDISQSLPPFHCAFSKGNKRKTTCAIKSIISQTSTLKNHGKSSMIQQNI